MKLVVFAHTPPPFHGQSYMVQLMLEGFGGDRRGQAGGRGAAPDAGIECYHVNARFSKDMEDIGGARFGKLVFLAGHCARALWCRYRYGARTLYYVPAPGKSAALYRDWLVMALCRRFFKRVVLHWHATSMADWLETSRNIHTRSITYRWLGKADLSIVLSQYNRFNAEKLWPRRVEVVPNGVPDPCPQFRTAAWPRRIARLAARKKLLAGEPLSEAERAAAGASPQILQVLFMAHCTREKGLFDAIHAVRLANEQLRAQNSPLSFQLVVTGLFPDPKERQEFDRLCPDATAPESDPRPPAAVRYAGFVAGAQKERAMLEADLMCFPSHWENQPVTIIEALAYGLPPAISRLPSVVEMLPAGYPGVADVENPQQLAAALLGLAFYDGFASLRELFVAHFTMERFVSNLAAVLRSVEGAAEPTTRKPQGESK